MLYPRYQQAYGWPFYQARKMLRNIARICNSAADALSARERLPSPICIKPLLPENRALHNKHRGQRCFILGNGPSLSSHNLHALGSEVTFAMNGFWRHPAAMAMQPDYYVFADPVFFDGSRPSWQFLTSMHRVIQTSNFLAPWTAAHMIRANASLPLDRTHFIASAGILRSAKPFDVDLTRTIPAINNCAQLAILAALYMGCSKIYLLGMEHDWLAQQGKETHFYAAKTLENHAIAHGERRRYADLMKDALELWQGYEVLRQCAALRRVEIVNCTRGGFLDVFERTHYEEALGLRRAA